jgi:hypothetical protein
MIKGGLFMYIDRVIDSHELLRLVKLHSRKNENEEGDLDYDIFVGFDDGSYEGIEVDTSYHITISDKFLYLFQVKEFLEKWHNRDHEEEEENAIWFIANLFEDGLVFELEDVERVFNEYIVDGDKFLVVKNHDDLLHAMVENPGHSIVVEWTR